MAEHNVATAHNDERDHGLLVLVVRKDKLTKLQKEPISTPYGDGKFAALETDEFGYLRVNLPAGGTSISEAPSVDSRLERIEILLGRLIRVMELAHGIEVSE